MKKTYNILTVLTFLCLFFSCREDEATITVINNIPNVRLDKVSYGVISVASYLIPGEKGRITIDERMTGVSFPMEERTRFYMTKGDTKVLLYTKDSFVVGKKDNTEIVLTEDTEVINPMSE